MVVRLVVLRLCFEGENVLLPVVVLHARHALQQQFQYAPRIADDVVVGLHVFVDLRPVDVNLDNFGLAGEGGRLQSHPVREPAAHGDEQVAPVAGHVGGLGPVHADHAGKQGVIAGAGAAAHNGGGHRRAQSFNKLAEGIHRAPGADHTAAHQQQRNDKV